MGIALKYTILAGDTYFAIATGLDTCQGVSAAQIEAANPAIPAASLQVGQIIAIPTPGSGAVALRYTVQPGDSYWDMASHINACAGTTVQDIEAANPGVSPSALQVGQVIDIEATGSQPAPKPQPPLVPADNIGYWGRTWLSCTAPAGTTMGLAFSGYTDPTQALSTSANVLATLVGSKYLTLGGGSESGQFTAQSLEAIDAAITAGQFSAYEGLAYDVERGSSGLVQAFQQSFARAKANGFKVLVTISHSAPYDIADAPTLMTAFIADANIDFLSPQLYTDGDETQNQWAISAGVQWTQYAGAKAAIIPSLVSASLYPDAEETFAGHGVTTQGYIVWKC